MKIGVKHNILGGLFLLLNITGYAQGWLVDENNIETNWNLTIQTGQAALISEMRQDFSASSNDMNNMSDWAFNIQLGKMVLNRFDIGFDFGLSKIKGEMDNPRNISFLNNHYYFNHDLISFKPFPINYNTNLFSYSLFFKYNFINFSSYEKGYFNVNLYSKLGVGAAYIATNMGYKDQSAYQLTGLSHPLYVNGKYPAPNKKTHIVITIATGVNYQISDRWFITAEANFQIINADYLDGVPNFSEQLTPQTPINSIAEFQIPVFDILGRFMLGATYFFNFDSKRQTRKQYLPWYANRYRSYYSKYQTTQSKKDRQERLPFYNDKME